MRRSCQYVCPATASAHVFEVCMPCDSQWQKSASPLSVRYEVSCAALLSPVICQPYNEAHARPCAIHNRYTPSGAAPRASLCRCQSQYRIGVKGRLGNPQVRSRDLLNHCRLQKTKILEKRSYNYGFCRLWFLRGEGSSGWASRTSGREWRTSGGRRGRRGAVEEDENVQRLVHIHLAHSRTS